MDYEQKYKELVERFDAIFNLDSVRESGTIYVEDIRKLIPELAESEDEKIRKEIIGFCKTISTGQKTIFVKDDNQWDRWIAWLEKHGKQKPAEWSGYDLMRLENCITLTSKSSKEETDWLISLRNRVLPQPKQEWSEEDEKKLLCVCAWIKDYPRKADFKDEMYDIADGYVDWLKSLRPQNHWKPSEEQLTVVKYFSEMSSINAINRMAFESLYNDLKKL